MLKRSSTNSETTNANSNDFLFNYNKFVCLFVVFLQKQSEWLKTLENSDRGVSSRWAGRAIAHPDFVKLEGAAKQRQRAAFTCPPSLC